MRYQLGAALIVLGMAGAALAQTVPPRSATAIVPTGIKRQIGFFAPLNADCTPQGDVQSRLTHPPVNGTAELDDGMGYTNYPPNTQWFHCNARPVSGVRVFYTSKEGYTGKDQFEADFFTATGQEFVWKYTVTVK